jgi:hypothetical protein
MGLIKDFIVRFDITCDYTLHSIVKHTLVPTFFIAVAWLRLPTAGLPFSLCSETVPSLI